MWSSDGTQYHVHGTGGDSLPHFCCPAAAATDFVNNAAAAAAKSARPAAAAHHSAATSPTTADPAPPAVPTGNAAFSARFGRLWALLTYPRGVLSENR